MGSYLKTAGNPEIHCYPPFFGSNFFNEDIHMKHKHVILVHHFKRTSDPKTHFGTVTPLF